jgi:hypothetical protein
MPKIEQAKKGKRYLFSKVPFYLLLESPSGKFRHSSPQKSHHDRALPSNPGLGIGPGRHGKQPSWPRSTPIPQKGNALRAGTLKASVYPACYKGAYNS